MNFATLTESQKTNLHALNGTRDSHYELARYCEIKGLHVEGDPDDMELSHVCVSAPQRGEDFWPLVVGTIRGDSEAVIEIDPSVLD